MQKIPYRLTSGIERLQDLAGPYPLVFRTRFDHVFGIEVDHLLEADGKNVGEGVPVAWRSQYLQTNPEWNWSSVLGKQKWQSLKYDLSEHHIHDFQQLTAMSITQIFSSILTVSFRFSMANLGASTSQSARDVWWRNAMFVTFFPPLTFQVPTQTRNVEGVT